MSSIIGIALSGLDASRLRGEAGAHNVANAQTAGYRRQEVASRTEAGGGVSAQVYRVPRPGADLAADLVDQQAASYTWKANLKVLQTSDRMLGALLDVTA